MKSNPHCEQLQKTFDCCEECFEISTAASENKKRFSIETKNRFNYCRIKVDACLISDDTHIKCDYAFLKCDILGAGINFQAKVRAANFCLKNFWQPQVATWGYSHSTPSGLCEIFS
jgi:hypothetical protein